MEKNLEENFNSKLVAAITVLIPILWILGLKFIFLQLTAVMLLLLNLKKIRFENKKILWATIFIVIFCCSNMIAIINNPLNFPKNEFVSAVYHLSYWVSGIIIINILVNTNISYKSVNYIMRAMYILAIIQVIILIISIIQWELGYRWTSNTALIYKLLPEKLQNVFLNEVMTLNIAIEDPILNNVYYRFNGFYVYPVAAGIASFYLLVQSDFTDFYKRNKSKANIIINRTLKIFTGVGLAICIITSRSRMVYVSIIIGLLLTILILVWNKRTYKKIIVFMFLMSIIVCILCIKLDLVSMLLNSRPNSSSDRFMQYKYALDTIAEYPLFGVGDKFKVSDIYLMIGSHSTYLSALVRSGIIGVVSILSFILITVLQILENKNYITNRKSKKIWFNTSWLFITSIIWMFTEEIDWPQIVAFLFFINIAVIYSFNKYSKSILQNEKIKIAFVTSSGGHLTHLVQMKSWWENKERIWVTFNKTDAESILKNEKKYWCYYPTNRNIKNLIKNTYLSIKILLNEKPDLIISTGAAVAIPFYYVGKIYGCRLVYIEVYDRIDSPTVTGRVVYPICDEFIVQWEEQLKFYPKAKLLGGLF